MWDFLKGIDLLEVLGSALVFAAFCVVAGAFIFIFA